MPEEIEEPKREISKVEEARQLLEKIEKANKETKEWIERAERLKADDLISGRSEAGKEPKKKDADEEITEAANKMLEGSGLKV